jgi:RNA polymerase sigma-70 factor, ECF subfamily
MPASAAAVYEQHSDFVFRSLQHLGVREADLEDLMQEVFVVVHRRLHTFNGSSKLTTWLFGICFRVVARQRRRAYLRWERQTDVLPEISDEHTPEDQCSDDQARRLLERVLGKLSLERRAVFVLFEVEGQSCQDIADLLGVPVGTVHSRLHTARKEVARAFARLAPTARNR